MRAWKVILAIALAAPVAYRFAAGGRSAADGRKTVVRYMAWGYPSQLKTDWELIKAFEARPENSDLAVEFVMAPMSSYYDKVQMMFASGTAPDIVRVNPDHFRAYIGLGYFKDLEPFIQKDGEYRLEDFFEAAQAPTIYKGRHYGVGVLFTTTIVYYNRTLFDEAGLEDPWQLYEAGRWNWETFLDTAKKMTVYEDGRPVQFGCNLGPSRTSAMMVINAMGGRLTTEDFKHSLVNSPEAIAALEWIKELIWKWRAAPTPEQSALSVFTFESGKVAMEFDSSGESPRLRDAITKFEWDVAPLPVGAGGYSSTYGAHVLTMNALTKAPDAAWRYMKFMTSTTAEQLLCCELRRCIPTRKAVASSEKYLTATAPPYNMRTFLADIDKPLPPYAYDEKWVEWSVEWQNQLDRVFLGGEDAQQVMDEAVVKIDAILNSQSD